MNQQYRYYFLIRILELAKKKKISPSSVCSLIVYYYKNDMQFKIDNLNLNLKKLTQAKIFYKNILKKTLKSLENLIKTRLKQS